MVPHLRLWVVTSEWPTASNIVSGIHVAQQVKYLREHGLAVDVFAFRGRANPFRYARAVWRSRTQHKAEEYDVIHAHHGQSGIVALCQGKRPVVVTFHGSDIQGIRRLDGRQTVKGYLLAKLSWLVAKSADEVIVVSQHLARYLPARSYQVIPAGVNMDIFFPRSQSQTREMLGLPGDQPLVLFVGSPDNPIKRYDLACQVIESTCPSLNATLLIANEVSQSQVALYMNACDALLLTSLHEGSPNAVKEALACNLPVVAVDVGDVRQRIGPVAGCVACDDDRPETITAALEQVLERRERVNGQAAVQDLDESLLTQKVIAVYERALARREMQQ